LRDICREEPRNKWEKSHKLSRNAEVLSTLPLAEKNEENGLKCIEAKSNRLKNI
jgi:hypothetical protein